MKRLILSVFLLALFGVSLKAQPHFGGHLVAHQLDSVTVTGTVIIDTSYQHDIYYLDLNADASADYFLNFGPFWYQPDSTTTRPQNGEQVTIIGGKFEGSASLLPVIVVYEINGKFWRDPYYANWNDAGRHQGEDSCRGYSHPYKGGYGFGWNHDSLTITTIAGIAIVDTTFFMSHYFLDTDSDGEPNYYLNFGPFWYKPESGAERPQDGDSITVTGALLGANRKISMIIVFEINGQVWRDTSSFHFGFGGWLSSGGNSRIRCFTNQNSYIDVHQGWNIGGHMMLGNIYGQMFEAYPENMPNHNGQNIFAAYEINMYNQTGMNFMWNGGRRGGNIQFGNNADFTLNYTQAQLDFYGLSESEIKVKYWDASLQSWITLNNNVTVDAANNNVSFSSNAVSNFYVLTDGSVTDVNAATEIPADFTLNQNYPNPFNPSTTISFTLPVSGYTTLKVYNILGKEIATLVNEFKQAGVYRVEFGTQLARQGGNSEFSSGVYFYKLESGNYTSTRKMILLK